MIRFRLFALLVGASLSAAGAAAAPPSEPAVHPFADPVEPPPVARAPDTSAGHLQLHVGPVLAVPFARLTNKTTFQQAADSASGIGADLGLGIDRGFVLGGYFQYLSFGTPDECPACDPNSFGFGAFARYHLVQGVRFDPWASLGVGYRSFDAGSTTYSGIDWMRLSLGGDWYALSQLGFGPYIELDLGTFTNRPSGTNAAVYATFAAGLHVVFDLPGK